MPIPRPREVEGEEEGDWVDSVVVKRMDYEGDERIYRVVTREATQTWDQYLESKQIDVSKLDFDHPNQPSKSSSNKAAGYDTDDERQPVMPVSPAPPTPAPPAPPTITITMMLPQAQATGGAMANVNPTMPVVVQITPPPDRDGRISKNTEHLLIAAGSIGATIIVAMLILAIHTIRKRGLSLKDAVNQSKDRVSGRGPPAPPKGDWDSRSGYDGDRKVRYPEDYGSMQNDMMTPAQPAMSLARSGSDASQRQLLRSDSFKSQQMAPERSASPHLGGQGFVGSPVHARPGHQRQISETPSSPVLPIQTTRESVSTRNTRSISNASELKYPDPPQGRAQDPIPPPPTFKQFLSNRPSASGRTPGGAMISRFSWTNSQAPQTPHDPNRETQAQFIPGRDSFMTQRSSIPRFRTIDSWVNQQSNRIEEQKLREQFRMTATSSAYSTAEDDSRDAISPVPEVPEIPKHMSASVKPLQTDSRPNKPLSPPPLHTTGLPGRNIRHERQDTAGTVDTVFRQHPGTEVRFSTRSAVPSEILDMGRKNTFLS